MKPVKGTVTFVSEVDGEAIFEVGLSPQEIPDGLVLKASFGLSLDDCLSRYNGDFLTDLTTNLAFHSAVLFAE